MPTMIPIVALAAEKSGGVVSLSRELGIKHTALYSWKRVPAERVRDISRITGLSPNDIRPDIFGARKAEPAA